MISCESAKQSATSTSSAQVPTCLSPKCPNAFRLPECTSAWEARCPGVLSARVPKCPSSAGVPKVPKCPSALSALSASCVWVPWESKCLSKSVSQSDSHSASLQGWFSKSTSTLRANFATGETWFNFQQ